MNITADIRLATHIDDLFSQESMDAITAKFMKNYMLNAGMPGSLGAEIAKRSGDELRLNALKPLTEDDEGPDMPDPSQKRPSYGFSKSKTRVRDMEMTVDPDIWALYQNAYLEALPTLFRNIKKIDKGVNNGGTAFNPFKNTAQLKLGISMPKVSKSGRTRNSPSSMNNFFLAAEFGTGIYATERFKTANRTSRFKVGNRGIWASMLAGDNAKNQATDNPRGLFLGQKPMHLFFDRSGNQRTIYAKFVRKKLPKAFLIEFKKLHKKVRN